MSEFAMDEKSQSSRHEALLDRLTQLAGHLHEAAAEGERPIHRLQDTLAQALAHEDLTPATSRSIAVENSDLFFADALSHAEQSRLSDLATRTLQHGGEPELRVAVRDVPVRSTQVAGSVPMWAGAAAVDRTLGPFLNQDGRQIWFDFFKITRLVALYVEGQPDPAVLFDVSLRKRIVTHRLPPIVDPQTHYDLVPDSVWVRASVLAANAPAGIYIGLRIRGGTLGLTAPAQVVDGKLTIAATTTATVTLDLDSAAAGQSDPSSAYGIDARNAALRLPTRLAFHFSGAARAIDEVAGPIDWRVYGQDARFDWHQGAVATYDLVLNRVLIPLPYSEAAFEVRDCQSPFTTFTGKADIQRSAWALPVGQIDVTKPSPAAGIGGLMVQCKSGLSVRWSGLEHGDLHLGNPYVLQDSGRINVTDLQAGNLFCTQEYSLWKDDVNPFGSSVKVQYTASFPLIYNTLANGTEVLFALVNANPLLDRPVSVTGRPFDIRSKGSTLIVALTKAARLLYLFDDNILFDNYNPNLPKTPAPQPLSIALHNALFKVTPVNGCLLFGFLAEDLLHVERGAVFLTFGMYAYVPTLPDPYAANLNVLRAQFGRTGARYDRAGIAGQTIWLWLVSRTMWAPADGGSDSVEVSFHFAPLQNQFALAPEESSPANATAPGDHPFTRLLNVEQAGQALDTGAKAGQAQRTFAAIEMSIVQSPDYQAIWDEYFAFLESDAFALLDVSSNADQMGVSFASFGDRRMAMLRTQAVAPTFPLQASGLDVVARGQFVRAFTAPQVSWEPVINLTSLDPGDPPVPLNYYPDDGGPAKILNNSVRLVPVAPIPVCDFLVKSFAEEPDNITAAFFTLPFGLRSLAFLYKTNKHQAKKPTLQFNRPSFANDLIGGLQLLLTAGSGFNDQESDMFRGYTLQMNNVLGASGQKTNTTTLGHDVSEIFNREFFNPSSPANLDIKRGVPLTRIDLSGYGESAGSNWVNKNAQFAETSQAAFEVFVGRTAHEVVQVKSILYPWGIHVVRTITLLRVGSGYVYRVDSGWKAESDGRFDFRFKYIDKTDGDKEKTAVPYRIHPGTIKGLFNVRNIKTALADVLPVLSSMDITKFYELDPSTNKAETYFGGASPVPVSLQPVYFDADVELENVVQGQAGGRVPSRRILGFVQLAPRGIPLTPDAFRALLDRQFGSIGGPLDCVMDIANTGQRIRVNRIDVNTSVDGGGTQPVFVAAARGSAILPKDGSWSLVAHAHATGEVTPLPGTAAVPVIRIGELTETMTYPTSELLRVANPADLLRVPGDDTVNYGFLQSTNTQKVLFLTPAFARPANDTTPGKLLSKTPPLFADAYRLVSSKAIFPNIGDAVTGFGDAIALTKDFVKNPLTDGGKQVLELMSINSADGMNRLKEDGYKLLNAVKNFDLPSSEWYLINEDYLKVYVEYRATTQNRDGSKQNRAGALNYDVDSFAADVANRWKSRMNNLAMVVDLGPLKRLMTIKGNFDAKKGAEASYTGNAADPDFPSPQIEFSKELQPVIDILQILQDLQGEKYGDAIKKGLKIAMGNAADSWEYKFDASKEIPVVRFPTPNIVYDDPNTPFKLEASLKLGAYFNAALTTAALSDPKKLLPTAGAYLEFYGRLSVMCVSLSVATVYAVGQVTLRIAGDTKVGPSLTMKFGFGAQIVVGLPVVGNVSVLYMVGVEIYADSTKLNVSAFLLFQGHADLLGGLVDVTITIEAKGTVSRSADRTDCAAQVTFAIDISIFLVIDISFSKSWEEQRQIA